VARRVCVSPARCRAERISVVAEAYRELSAGVRFLLVTHRGHETTAEAAPAGGDRPVGRSLMVMSATAGEGKTSIATNPTELLASPGMRSLQWELAVQTDLVICDTPAALAVPDALELGRYVDLAILVGHGGHSSRRQLTAAIERLEQVGTDIAGTVLNDIDSRSDGYYYSYYYRDDDEPEERSGWFRRRAPRPSEDEAAASVPAGDDTSAAAGAGLPATLRSDPLGGSGVGRRGSKRRQEHATRQQEPRQATEASSTMVRRLPPLAPSDASSDVAPERSSGSGAAAGRAVGRAGAVAVVTVP